MNKLDPFALLVDIPKKLKVELPYCLAVLLLDIYAKELKIGSQKRHLQFHVHYGIEQ